MSERRPRPFTAIDGLILAASFALGLTGAVLADPGYFSMMPATSSQHGPWPGMPGWARDLEFPVERIQWDFATFLGLMSPGAGVATFRRGVGRRCRGGFPGPGVAATAAASAVLLFEFALTMIAIVRNGNLAMIPANFWLTEAWHSWDFYPSGKAVSVSGAILGVWAYLVLARAWRARDDWRDWLGRWLAWCWLGHALATALSIALWG